MKKLLLMFLAVAGMTLVSCENKQTNAETSASDSTKVEATTPENGQAAADAPALADIVEKAKTEGAKWTPEQWKENFVAALKAFKPCSDALKAMSEKAQGGDVNAMDDAQNIEEQFPNYPQLINEFFELSQKHAKDVITEDFAKKTMEELGIEM